MFSTPTQPRRMLLMALRSFPFQIGYRPPRPYPPVSVQNERVPRVLSVCVTVRQVTPIATRGDSNSSRNGKNHECVLRRISGGVSAIRSKAAQRQTRRVRYQHVEENDCAICRFSKLSGLVQALNVSEIGRVLIEELVEPIDAFRKRLAITPAVLFLISAVTAV